METDKLIEKRIFRNVVTNFLVQIVLAVSALIIPRYILAVYGSEMNGLVASISQFITYAALVEMGIGDATVIALYRPIAKDDKKNIELIISGAGRLYRRSGYVYMSILLLIAVLYPLLIGQQFEYWFIFELVLCIGLVNAIDYFIWGKYKPLLIADQKYYVLNIARTLATIILTIGSIILLYRKSSVISLKCFAVVTHLGEALSVCFYVRKKYGTAECSVKDAINIEHRWNALIHQICATIVYNTDLVVLTIFLPKHTLSEISVYTVYNMVFMLLTNLIASLVKGLNASFGDLAVKREDKKLVHLFETYELFYFMVVFVMDISFAVLIVPFVACYTNGIYDARYVRYEIGILMTICGLFAQIKDLSASVNLAMGKLKETQKYAVLEAVSNIVISLLLVRKYGIVGVLVGTLLSHLLMTIGLMRYTAKELVIGTGMQTIKRLIRNLAVSIILVMLELFLISNKGEWYVWIWQGCVTVIINTFVITGINYWAEPAMICGVIKSVRSKWTK